MSYKLFFTSIGIFLLSINSYALTNEADTTRSNQLLVKTSIFYPVALFISNDEFRPLLSLFIEYKTKPALNFGIGGNLSKGKNENEGIYNYEIIPEYRYYKRNHFFGGFIKFSDFESNTLSNIPFRQKNIAFGLQYGYQKEWGRFNLEGRLGFGLAYMLEHYGNTKIGLYFFNDDDYYSPFIDLLLDIYIGYRIF